MKKIFFIDEIEFHDIIVAVRALQETWKIPHVHQLIIIGFPPLLYTGRQGAGEVSFYINTDINFFKSQLNFPFLSNVFENMTIELNTSKEKLICK